MVTPIPGSLSFEQAAVLPLALSTAASGLFGNILLTAKGCIAAEISIVQGPDTSPVATTPCLTIKP